MTYILALTTKTVDPLGSTAYSRTIWEQLKSSDESFWLPKLVILVMRIFNRNVNMNYRRHDIALLLPEESFMYASTPLL